MALYTMNIGGNLHDAARAINSLGMADYLLSIHDVSPGSTIAVFRGTVEQVKAWRESSPSWCGDHSDLEGGES